ncbi:MAG TPA: serine/threonine-protein kinase, partial [Chitinivibrionales bacterium]
MEADSIHPPNFEIERYSIVRQIGAGGMATVYLAQDLLLGREVALKMLHAHLINSPESVQRFEGEARAVAAISHENVIRIFDCGKAKSRPYLVMEYIQGMTLKDIFDRYGTIPNMVAVEMCRQILLGLACAHGRGVIHRDIKPDNIMIDLAGTVKITDFGIAYIVNKESLTLTGSLIGSPRAMSPEQARGKPLSGTTDIFSLGVLLYTACAGKPPFDADVASAIIHAIINDTPDPVCRKSGAILFWLSDFI